MRIRHIYWELRCILTEREILPKLSQLISLYSQKSAGNSFARESEALKFVTDKIDNINQYGVDIAASKVIHRFGYILNNLQFNNAIYGHKDSVALSESIFQDIQDKDAYEIGYQFANIRKEMFPWNNEMEYLLDLTPVEAKFRIRQVFGKYSNSFDL